MAAAIDETNSSNDVYNYLQWVLEAGIWNGREVSWAETSEFCEEIQGRVFKLLFSNSDTSSFDRLAAQLAWLGTPDSNRSLLARGIQELDFSKSCLIQQAGLGKSISKFWKKHKTEIIIGVAVLAVVTVVAVVAISTAGAAAAAAGGAAIGSSPDKKPQPPSKGTPPSPYIAKPALPSVPPVSLDSPEAKNQLVFNETGLLANGRYTTHSDILSNRQEFPASPGPATTGELPSPPQRPFAPNPSYPSLPTNPWNDALLQKYNHEGIVQPPPVPSKPTWMGTFVETVQNGVAQSTAILDRPPPNPKHSTRFSTLGERAAHMGIGGINGMNTSVANACDHAEYIAKLAKGQSIDWVYNRTHGAALDLAEIFSMNYLGISPKTSDLLLENWEAFHEANGTRPDAKYLQFCHSQGAIHVRNALAKASDEIQDRVIVVAIAPGAIVPDELCCKSYNYASKKDIVHYGEMLSAGALDPNETGTSERMKKVMAAREELIILEPHPDATEIDHDFQSPTFITKMSDHLKEYIRNNGEYR